MPKQKLKAFDAADYLDNPETRTAYIAEAMQTRDAAFISRAIGNVAKAHGMTGIANETGLSRESLYRALGTQANPEFSTIIKVLDSLDLELSVQPKDTQAA
jgi:probable addiction module antidote protein